MHRHKFDPISFVFGLAFLALAVAFVIPADPWDVFFAQVRLGWLWPLVVTAAGLALLAPALRKTDSPEDAEDLDIP